MNEAYSYPQPYRQKLTWTSLLAETYSTYQKQFWSFWRIAMPIALLAFLFRQGERALIHSIFDRAAAGHSIPEWLLSSSRYAHVLTVVDSVEGAVYWILSTILFAAIAKKIIQEGEDNSEQPLSDAYSSVRPRLKILLIFAIVTWTPFWLARLLAFFCGLELVRLLQLRLGSFPRLVVFYLPLLAVAALSCRMALAVPELMNDASTLVRKALGSSFRLTENWEPFFMFFLAKSAIVGYGVYWLAQLGLDALWTRTNIGSSAYAWIASAVYIAIAATLESPLFIAFCILYRDSQPEPDAAPTEPAIG